jgi:hypothetical protein
MAETDVFWHIQVGQQLWQHHGFPQVDPWSFTFQGTHWKPTAWLTELLFYGVYQLAGASGINVLRIALVTALCGALMSQLLPRRTPWIGAAVFATTVLPMSAFDQERPQLISFLMLVWLATACRTAARDHVAPNLCVVGGLTWLWANFHGYWSLAPVALVLTALAIVSDSGRTGWPIARRCVYAAGVSVLAAALTPLGPGLVLTPLTVSDATRGVIAEWLPAKPAMPYAIGIDMLLLAIAVCWARSATHVPRGELLWIVVWSAFAFVAARNIAPAMLLIAPLVADRLELTYGDQRQGPLVPKWLLLTVAGLGLAAVTLLQYAATPVDPTKPHAIAATLAAQSRPIRVLNDYNVSGYLILFGGKHIKLAIDGRADRYGRPYIKRYTDAVAGTDWRQLVAQLRPDVAVLPRRSPLVDELNGIGNWRIVLQDVGWTLLERPGFHLATPAMAKR